MEDPTRFLRERAEIEILENEEDWVSSAWRFSEDGSIEVDLDMTIHGRVYAGRMTYPGTFPNSPPYISPRDKSERWSNHQYGPGGPLCLEWRPDNWQPGITGADMVRSAHKLLSTEQHPELPHTVPSAHRLTAGQGLRGSSRRFVATAAGLANLLSLPLPSQTRLKTATIYSSGAVVMFLVSVADAHDVLQVVSDIPGGITTSSQLFSIPGEGLIFRSETADLRPQIDSADALIQVLTDAGFATDDIIVQEAGRYQARSIILLGKELSSLQVFSISPGDKLDLKMQKVVWPSCSDIRLSDESQKLATIRVGIVGLGSVGSKVAVSLARSGIRRFLLVDDDYLASGNTVRHELSWANVGTHKALAVSDALSLVAADVKVDTSTARLAGQESAASAAAALKDLSNCDLLIDATANPEVFLLLAALAKQFRTPLCWGEIFAGGYGGMIARARPGRDPNPLAVRDAYHNYLATLPPAPQKNAAGYDGDEEEPLVAYDSDVGFVAAALTRLGLDTALCRDPSDFPYSVYLLAMRREWIFEAPFDTRPIEVQGGGWEHNENAVGDADRIAALEILLKMDKGRAPC